MSELVESLVNLTALRDRDALDVALVSTIRDLLLPESTAIYRQVGDPGNERWLTSASLTAEQRVASSDSEWDAHESLPHLADHPLRQQALVMQQAVQSVGDGNTLKFAAFALSTRLEPPRVLEIATKEALSSESLRQVVGILRLYRNFQSVLDYGERDSLTELLNRKTFDSAFMKAAVGVGKAARDDDGGRRHEADASSYWLAVMDIDHFKRVNDNFGHLIGDEVLLLLARLMRECFRLQDQLYRFGGEEFVVLMRCADEDAATLSLERFRIATENHAFPQVGRITISIGFSALHPGDTPSGAFERADKAVYHAKAHGRNQVCSYHSLLAQGEIVEAAAASGEIELF